MNAEDKDLVFVTIYRADRDWINETKGDMSRFERLHEIIERDRRIREES